MTGIQQTTPTRAVSFAAGQLPRCSLHLSVCGLQLTGYCKDQGTSGNVQERWQVFKKHGDAKITGGSSEGSFVAQGYRHHRSHGESLAALGRWEHRSCRSLVDCPVE